MVDNSVLQWEDGRMDDRKFDCNEMILIIN